MQPPCATARFEDEAMMLAEAGCFSRAAELFARAIALEPTAARLHEAQAQCFMELECLEEACTAAALAVELAPQWSVSHATHGRALLNAGQLQCAVESFGRAFDLERSDADLEAELRDAQALLERHWAEHHDLCVTLGDPNGTALRIRQCMDCRYCQLGAGDGPGGAVWAAGVALAQFLSSAGPPWAPGAGADGWRGVACLELGSGTGVAGLAAASLGAEVLLTDQEPLVANLRRNSELNRSAFERAGGQVEVAAFDWALPAPQAASSRFWDIVIASDLVYSFTAAPLFAMVLAAVLAKSTRGVKAAIYAHNPRSKELDIEMHAAFDAHGLIAHVLPHQSCKPVGNIGQAALDRIVMFQITIADQIASA